MKSKQRLMWFASGLLALFLFVIWRGPSWFDYDPWLESDMHASSSDGHIVRTYADKRDGMVLVRVNIRPAYDECYVVDFRKHQIFVQPQNKFFWRIAYVKWPEAPFSEIYPGSGKHEWDTHLRFSYSGDVTSVSFDSLLGGRVTLSGRLS